ncbi:MAG: hypothetical protein KJ720_11860 [Proteobacteria bacterium]|nr:hypothetical protein [Pseudomonadota bacterium]MBU1452689.1 hypothetical protein [Pseudomonadota bacterium]MBU2467212.1 hypothetical protein [Pseudomonadota bacterium]MBU2518976.1 hypothetical protein [Pseudomonadota bacterium]
MDIKVTELVITVLYFLFCIWIGVYFSKKAGTGSKEFWGAGQNIPFWVNGFATFSSNVSAASFLGFLGLSYKMGWSFTTIGIGSALAFGYAWSTLLNSGPLRRYSELRGKFTLASFFSERYGHGTGLATSIFIIILFPLYIVPQLIGGGLAGSYILGIDFKYAVMLIASVYIIYVVLAGMKSVTWADFLQGVIMLIFMVGLSLTAFYVFGGWDGLMPKALAIKPHFLDINPKLSTATYVGMFFAVALFAFSSPHIIMRHFTAKNVAHVRGGVALTSFLCWVFHLIGYIGVAAACILIVPDLVKVDRTYIVVMNKLWPPLLRGCAVAGILAAIMSTTGGMLLATGVEFSDNIVRKFIKKDMTDNQVIILSKVVMALVGVITTIMALGETRSIGFLVALLVGGTASAFSMPILFGLWWKRANRWGGLLSCVGGLGVYVVVHFTKIMPFLGEVLISIPASILFMVVGSLLTAPPPKEIQEFVEDLHRHNYMPATEAKKV